jgi:hypothetical protein
VGDSDVVGIDGLDVLVCDLGGFLGSKLPHCNDQDAFGVRGSLADVGG